MWTHMGRRSLELSGLRSWMLIFLFMFFIYILFNFVFNIRTQILLKPRILVASVAQLKRDGLCGSALIILCFCVVRGGDIVKLSDERSEICKIYTPLHRSKHNDLPTICSTFFGVMYDIFSQIFATLRWTSSIFEPILMQFPQHFTKFHEIS